MMAWFGRTFFTSAAIFVLAISLVACSAQTKVDKIESIKDPSFSAPPKKLSIIFGNNVEFGDGFTNNAGTKIRACGVQTSFFFYNNFKSADFYKASDAVMTVSVLNHDTTTRSAVGYASTYVSRSTYEFTLQDPKTEKNLWRARMDFHQADPKDKLNNAYRNEQDPDFVWADALVAQMKKDGLLPGCH